jgi:hypothetical protein
LPPIRHVSAGCFEVACLCGVPLRIENGKGFQGFLDGFIFFTRYYIELDNWL